MRAKVVLSASGLALLILAPTLYFHFKPDSKAPDQAATVPVAEQVAAAPQASAIPAAPHHSRVLAPVDGGEAVSAPDAAADSSAANHEEYVAKREAELTELGMSDDPADLKVIVSELNNKEPRIRSSALSAVMQFHSQDAIPALQHEIAWTDDPQEKVDLLKAIEYLKLPTFSEFQANNAGAAPDQ
jgi:hypothetical protein